MHKVVLENPKVKLRETADSLKHQRQPAHHFVLTFIHEKHPFEVSATFEQRQQRAEALKVKSAIGQVDGNLRKPAKRQNRLGRL